jgi:3-oxoacyl-[acyl-carrier-protein] synthase-3
MTTSARYARIVGTGSDLPGVPVSNAQLVAQLAQQGVSTSDEWITQRTGIGFRHFAAPHEGTSDLAQRASVKALMAARLQAQDLDLIIVATTTPDQVFPSTAALLQGKLGALTCPAFDVQAVCSGFIYALSIATAMIESGQVRTALVVGAEVFSRLLDFQDRTTCVLFGDGAGAVVLQASETPGVLATHLKADGRQGDVLCTPGRLQGGQIVGSPFIHMDGQAVFKLAVGAMADASRCVLEQAGISITALNHLIPHQANIRIMESLAKRLELPMDRVMTAVSQHGNTSAASIPLALDMAVSQGRICAGQTVLMTAVGGGLTWGAVLCVWADSV